LIIEKIPLFIISLGLAVFLLLTHTSGLGSVQAIPLSSRLANAVVSCVMYVGQMFCPSGLTPFYGYVSSIPAWQIVLSVLLLKAVSMVAFVLRKRFPYLITGWVWYLVMLAPVSGLVQAGAQARADRYTYLSQIGLYLMVVWGLGDVTRHWRLRKPLLAAAAIITLGSLMISARQLTAAWRDSEALWKRAVAVGPNSDFAHASLADLFLRQGRVPEAIARAEAALRVNPDNADAHNHLALAIVRRGRLSEAVAHWERSLEIHPDNLNAKTNLAWVLATAPSSHLRNGARAVELVEPVASGAGYANAFVLRVLGAAYAEEGRFSDAIAVTERALASAHAQGDVNLTDSLRAMIGSYQASRPLRDNTLAEKNQVPPALARPQ
jgi:tetratricopeptide (TPR) repeat protein